MGPKEALKKCYFDAEFFNSVPITCPYIQVPPTAFDAFNLKIKETLNGTRNLILTYNQQAHLVI